MESILSSKTASHGWHYGKNMWKQAKKHEIVFTEKESSKTALEHDPYSIAWKKKNKSKITADVVGHVPKEISRTVFFLISRGGKVVGVCWMKSATPRPFQKEDLKFY